MTANANKNSFYVAGVGASAGGLEALQEFFKSVSLQSGVAYVVVQHLSPDYKSLMDELLARHTKLPIKKIESGMEIQPNTIYLIPPKNNLTVFHGKLLLEENHINRSVNLPIDVFFRSLATDLGSRAVGVILSGTGSDGTLGIKAIKEAGGMVMVQTEKTAKFDGMPKSSIATGLVDYILPPAEMPEALMNYIKHPFISNAQTVEKALEGNEDVIVKLMSILREHSGVDFSFYKENTLNRRLERRMSINRVNQLEDYLDLLRSSNEEKEILSKEFLIGVTRFFRDEAAWQALQERVLLPLLDGSRKSIRIWSVGVSTGEEVYSLALSIRKILDASKLDVEVKIFATDVDKRAIEQAGNGYFLDGVVSDIEPALLQRYFQRKENGWLVSEQIRKMVIFATHNILRDPPFSKLDLITCRNLFIYLKSEAQLRVLNMFYLSLAENGNLFLGSSESLGELSEAFHVVSVKNKIYRKKAGYSATLTTDVQIPRLNYLKSEENKVIPLKDIKKQQELSQKLLGALLPPSILLNDDLMVVQLFNDVNPFLQLQSGAFSHHLASLLSQDFQVIIHNIIRRLRNQAEPVTFENISVPGNKNRLDIQGRSIEMSEQQRLFLISFVEKQLVSSIGEAAYDLSMTTEYADRMRELEHDLQFVRESLQATVEELETSNEELQSSNEELIASNEELQSTNEELQSVNEELFTVNSEYQSKIEELTQLNNDITNLLNNTGIAALYLDRKLCIRKITPAFVQLSNIMDLDIGRPIAHFANHSIYPGFLNDIEEVQKSLQVVEKEIVHQSGTVYLLRMAPYRTDFQAVDGLLITLVSLHSIQQEREQLHTSNRRLQSALQMGNMAWWEWYVPTGKVSMHEKKATMLGYTLSEFPDDVYKITELIHPDDYEETMQQMRNHLEGKAPAWDVEYRIKMKSGGYKWYHDKGGIVERGEQGEPVRLVGLVMDISDQKNTHES